MGKIGKQDIVDEIMQKTGVTRKEADTALNTILDIMTDHLKAGDKVTVTNFGTFEVQQMKERMGRNLHTGKEIKIPAHNRVSFKAGKSLADGVR